MGRCCNAIKIRSHNSGGIKWPKTPSQKPMKARKSSSSMDKTQSSFLMGRHHDPVGSTGLPSVKHKTMSENKTDLTHMNNTSRGSVRWSVPLEGVTSPSKMQRDATISTRPLHSYATKPSTLMPSPGQGEKSCDNRQKLRKASVASSVAFRGSHIKDWSRGRSKRV